MGKLRHGGVARILLDALNRCRLTIQPYLLFRERIAAQSNEPIVPDIEDFTVDFLAESDLAEIAAIPHRRHSLQQLGQLLREGKLCLGMKHGGEIIAFTWCDLQECRFIGDRFELRSYEAYLFDAYTRAAWRGRNIAPYLRARLYRELDRMGRSQLYSVSGYLNKPALRFKQKLGAESVRFGIHIDLFGLKNFHILIRDYEARRGS